MGSMDRQGVVGMIMYIEIELFAIIGVSQKRFTINTNYVHEASRAPLHSHFNVVRLRS